MVFFCSASVSSGQFDILDKVYRIVASVLQLIIETSRTYPVRVDDLLVIYTARLGSVLLYFTQNIIW